MQRYEYQAVVAPARAEKVKGLKTPAERFAHTVSAAMNEMARQGWEYLRADVLPSEERSGLTGRATVHHTLLVFRRPLGEAAEQGAPEPSLRIAAPVPPPMIAPSPAAAPGEAPLPPLTGTAPRAAAEPGPAGQAAALARALFARDRATPPPSAVQAPPKAAARIPRLFASAKEGSAPRLGAAPEGGNQG